MTILITSDDSFFCADDKKPEVGKRYVLEDATSGTLAQNRYFHKLVLIYFNSGCYSDDVRNAEELKQEIKKRIGVGYVAYKYDSSGDIPKWVRGTSDNEKCNRTLLASWADYTKKERRSTIDSLIQEMITTGVHNNEFEEMIKNIGDIWQTGH